MAFSPIPSAHQPAPNPNQGNEQFNVNAQGFVNSLQPVIDGMNRAGNDVSQLRDEASDASVAAVSARAGAQSSANMAAAAASNRGDWSILPSTAAAPPYSVNYGGSTYLLQRSLTNVRSVTPGTDPNTWFNYSQSASGLTVVTSPTDTTVDRVVNTQWDFYRAVFSFPALDIRTSGLSIDVVGSGGVSGGSLVVADARNGQVPEAWAYIVSTDRLFGTWWVQYATQLYPEPGLDRVWVRTGGSNSFDGRPWVPLHGGGGSGDTTSAMQGFVNLGEMGASGGVNATLDLSAGRCFFINMNNANTTGGFTFSLSNIPASGAVDAILFVSRPTRKGSITLPANVKWARDIVPALSSVSNAIAAIHIWKLPSWTNFRASVNAMENAP